MPQGSPKIVPVILAGGSGTRLWPASRDAFPKQFQPLTGELSTYQQTLRRVADPALFDDPVVITSDAFRFFARRQAADIGVNATVVLEPARRDSAAAVAAAAAYVAKARPGSAVLRVAGYSSHLPVSNYKEVSPASISEKIKQMNRRVELRLYAQPTYIVKATIAQ